MAANLRAEETFPVDRVINDCSNRGAQECYTLSNLINELRLLSFECIASLGLVILGV